jgi:glucosamine--fructose-6-phosphate aminotransferase (isomerizing)
MWDEIGVTGEALRETARRLAEVAPLPAGPLLFSGCGSSRHLARAAAALAARWERAASAVPASALWLRPDSVPDLGKRPRVVGISRSGETTEVVASVEVAAARGLPTFALTAAAPCALRGVVAEGLALIHLQEASLVMTHTFGCMLLALLRLCGAPADSVAAWAEAAAGRLPAALEAARMAARDGEVRRFVFLGSGAFEALADEAQLKLLEASQAEAYAFDAWEFRHGPISLVDAATLVIWLGGDPRDADVLEEVRALGGRAFSLPEALGGAAPDAQAVLEAGPFSQALACLWAGKTGRDPDQPPHLGRVVRVAP